ncbi:aminopeptidase P N-terminal domain-containing protein [Oleiagrimonas sp. C23AA]|uniref:aminopeptidase P N-terminal domain-containing protein n=1 Tax=Oleiagrimonas sp. C23AA TaxID=2719047 RepID=UPI001424244A|nr:aminopeptidase P N-terminal domain-containing protein [Oleiagrimonas sp. C23AA]NII09777.1 M24 family metallopeptidase [Oleiagrimonas sp. C23AA]
MIGAAEFARRRRQLMRMAGADAAVLVAAAPERMRSADAAWPYRQDSDFHYLCGFPEPEAVLALLPGRGHGEVVLFCRENDAEAHALRAPVIGAEAAIERFGVDDAFPVADIDDILPGMLEGRERVFCHFGREPGFDAQLMGWMRRLRTLRGGGIVPKEFQDLGHLLHDLRLFKSRTELRLMRRAAALTAEAHRDAMRLTRPGRHEFEIEAEWLHAVRRRGAVAAFTPNVAGGERALIVHYHANNARLADGEMVMLDAGAEIDCYAADITRTYPVNGRFSPTQRALYEVVLQAHTAALQAIAPGRAYLDAHEAALDALAEGLCRLGVLPGSAKKVRASGALERLFPHKTSHWLGMDVHDVGDYRVADEPRLLEPNMVLTVEPGLYIPADATDIDPKWRGMGIRIEDDVVVTRDGHEVLTDAVPRDIPGIEALMAGSG